VPHRLRRGALGELDPDQRAVGGLAQGVGGDGGNSRLERLGQAPLLGEALGQALARS
jgi:hypothetical protein